MPIDIMGQLSEKKGKRASLLMPRTPLIIGSYSAKDSGSAKNAGLRGFDKIVQVDSMPVTYFDELAGYLQNKKGDTVLISALRGNQAFQVKVLVDKDGKIGLNGLSAEQYDSLDIFKLETKKYGFLASFPAGIQKAGQRLDSYVQLLSKF